MRKWGVVVTGFYGLILVALLTLLITLVVKPSVSRFKVLQGMYQAWAFWIFAGIMIGGEALLLFLSVDTQHKRLKPRAHVLLSTALVSVFVALLSLLVIASAWLVFHRDEFKLPLIGENVWLLLGVLWVGWAIVFFLYARNAAAPVNTAVNWLLRGSVLELLVVVPCHVWVRRRDDCSAPGVTALGIASGIAIMLMSFGPGVLLLFKKRLDSYAVKTKAAAQ